MYIITDLLDLLHEPLLEELLHTLRPDTQPLWGRMTAQHMVEHVGVTMEYMTNKRIAQLSTPEDRIPLMKRFLASDKELQQNFISPVIGDIIPDLLTNNLDEARALFWQEWHDWKAFLETPSPQSMHPVFGLLNREEIIRANAKHLRHHFKQFGLVS